MKHDKITLRMALAALTPYANPADDPDTGRGDAQRILMEALGLNQPPPSIKRELVSFSTAGALLQKKAGRALWAPAVHGVNVLVAEDGQPVGTVRLLGPQLPKKDQRFALRITGCAFWHDPTRVSPSSYWNEVLSFPTADEAMAYGDAVRAIMVAEVSRPGVTEGQ